MSDVNDPRKDLLEKPPGGYKTTVKGAYFLQYIDGQNVFPPREKGPPLPGEIEAFAAGWQCACEAIATGQILVTFDEKEGKYQVTVPPEPEGCGD